MCNPPLVLKLLAFSVDVLTHIYIIPYISQNNRPHSCKYSWPLQCPFKV
uniref:Uncharacterized protein n=1 Tax=Rhizophora mucronata TaxID=61149 RepID=A0A2P2ISH3_RHIMU